MDHETDVDARRACAGGLDTGGRPSPCAEPVAEGAPVPLCTAHLGSPPTGRRREHGVGTETCCPRRASRAARGSASAGRRAGSARSASGGTARSPTATSRLPGSTSSTTCASPTASRSAPRPTLGAARGDPARQLLAFERGDRHVEHARHAQFAAHRLGRSEWFTPRRAARARAGGGGRATRPLGDLGTVAQRGAGAPRLRAAGSGRLRRVSRVGDRPRRPRRGGRP